MSVSVQLSTVVSFKRERSTSMKRIRIMCVTLLLGTATSFGTAAFAQQKPKTSTERRDLERSGKWAINQVNSDGRAHDGVLILTEDGPKLSGRAKWSNHKPGI